VADITELESLLHGEETDAFADAGYTGVTKRELSKSRRLSGTLRRREENLKDGSWPVQRP